MRARSRIRLAAIACCLFSGGPARAEISGHMQSPCEVAGAAAEKAHGLPAGLLLAIGRVESGRWDALRGRTIPWPFAINAGGKGQWFETKEAAARAVNASRMSGVQSIDAGCFQISLMYHAGAFTTLETAFEPEANAVYAARLLTTLFARTGSWETAVEAYHTSDPARGLAYREQVFATWLAPGTAPPSVHTGIPPGLLENAARPATGEPVPAIIAGVRVWTPRLAGGSSGVVTVIPSPVQSPPGRAALPAVIMPDG